MMEQSSLAPEGMLLTWTTVWTRYEEAAKRAIDVVVSVLALVLLAPLIVALAVAIKLDSPGPVLFRQQRLGKRTRSFTILKFRSMYVGADDAPHREAVRRFAAGQPVAIVDGRPMAKPSQDPRVTRAGRFLRATGLDELPQLINVLRGEMSLVGPRPAIPYELEFHKEWHYRRYAVRPGITGLWQVRRRTTVSLDDMVRQDLEYIDSFTLWLDFKLLLATVPRIFLRGWSF